LLQSDVAFLQFFSRAANYFAKNSNMKSIFGQASFTWLVVYYAVICLTACNNSASKPETNNASSIQSVFDKLVGTWQNKNATSFERWTKKLDGSFQSVVFSINGKDTLWNERASIYPENGGWVFENAVKDENEGKAVKFTSSALSKNSVQFSNPAHDFPTDINYTIVDENTVHAFIVGPNDKGGKDTILYYYTRAR
jgi:hypothetical protein